MRVKCTIGGVENTLFGFISTILKIKVLSIEVVNILSLQEVGVTTGFKVLTQTSSCFLDYLSEWKMAQNVMGAVVTSSSVACHSLASFFAISNNYLKQVFVLP